MDVLLFIGIGLLAGAIAFAAAWYVLRVDRDGLRVPVSGAPRQSEPTEILIEDGVVQGLTPDAARFLDLSQGERAGWPELAAALRPHFASVPETPPNGETMLPATDGSHATLTIFAEDARVRAVISARTISAGDVLRAHARNSELAALRRAMALSPWPVWTSDGSEQITWCNSAFHDMCSDAGGSDGPRRPFDVHLCPDKEIQSARVSVRFHGQSERNWYEVHSIKVPDGWQHFGVNIDAVIRSETTQRSFLQTLTRIFAHLPIGLAIFDRDRRLVLFNPALVDLTTLSAEFLSGRPNLFSFFDQMREKRMMPEPKSYPEWRAKLTELIAAASSDLYVETWTLPAGPTYRITGRPHPEGGIAFLFEDISAEISLTRRFRHEIEISNAVLDSIEDAVAVFSRAGSLTLCNEAYREMWKSDPDSAFADTTISDATQLWQAACEPSPIWSELRDFVLALQDRAPWDAELRLANGLPLLCRVEPLPGGASLIRFTGIGAVLPAPPLPHHIDA